MKKEKILQFKQKIKPSISKGFALFNEGKCLYNDDKDDLALKKFIKAKQLGYESSEMYTCMGWIYGNLDTKKYFKLIIRYLNKAIELDEENGYAYYLKGATYEKNNHLDEALETLLKAEKIDYEEPTLYTKIAYIYQVKNNFLKANAYASKAVNKYPKDRFCYYKKGEIYYVFEQYAQAIKYFLKAEKLGMIDCDIYFKISYCCSMIDEPKKALIYANKAIILDKKNAYGYYRKGFVYYMIEDYDNALKAFLTAEKLKKDDNDFSDMFARMSWIYQNNNALEKALKYSDKALKCSPKDAYVQYRKGCIYAYGLKKYSESLKYFKKAYALDKTETGVFFDLANSYMNLKKYKLGLKYIDEGLKFFPGNPDLLRIKTAILYLAGKQKESKELLEDLLKTDPEDVWVKQGYGMTLCEMKDYETAIKYLEPIKEELHNINPFALFSLSVSYYKTKNYEKSIQIFLQYSQKENLEDLECKDKKEIRNYIKKLEKKFLNDDRLYEIKKKFKSIL